MIKIDFDRDFLRESTGFLSGVDEVGRGCLAGPVVSSCVCLEYEKYKEAESCLVSLAALGVTDSKKLSPKKRQQIIKHFHLTRSELKLDQKFLLWEFNNCSLTAAISSISNTWIDKMNILNASLLSMKNAFEQVYTKNRDGILLVDGNRIPALHHLPIIVKPVVKGDQKSYSIAAASILAKVYRDRLMLKYHEEFPVYGFDTHVGYGTKKHLENILKYGLCRLHRRSFLKNYV